MEISPSRARLKADQKETSQTVEIVVHHSLHVFFFDCVLCRLTADLPESHRQLCARPRPESRPLAQNKSLHPWAFCVGRSMTISPILLIFHPSTRIVFVIRPSECLCIGRKICPVICQVLGLCVVALIQLPILFYEIVHLPCCRIP